MLRVLWLAFMTALLLKTMCFAGGASEQTAGALRVGIVGLVHGHVHGFLEQSRHSPQIEIVGISDPDRQLLSQAASKYGFDQAQLFTDLDAMIAKTHPQAVLVYTNTYDHRSIVETCAR